MTNQIETLLTYTDIVALANEMDCRLVSASFETMIDDLEYQIYNDYNESIGD